MQRVNSQVKCYKKVNGLDEVAEFYVTAVWINDVTVQDGKCLFMYLFNVKVKNP